MIFIRPIKVKERVGTENINGVSFFLGLSCISFFSDGGIGRKQSES